MSIVSRQALCDAATPRPWTQTVRGFHVRADGIVHPVGHCYDDPAASFAFMGETNAALIVAAVNEHESLLACEAGLRALVGFLRPDNRHAIHARDTLERLDQIRATS